MFPSIQHHGSRLQFYPVPSSTCLLFRLLCSLLAQPLHLSFLLRSCYLDFLT